MAFDEFVDIAGLALRALGHVAEPVARLLALLRRRPYRRQSQIEALSTLRRRKRR